MVNTNTKIYIANLGKYNEGELVGEWIDLPFDELDLQELFERIKLGYFDEDGDYIHGFSEGLSFYEEFVIHDYETDLNDFKINEYDDIYDLNDLIDRVESLDDYDYDKLQACLSLANLEYCLDSLDNFDYYPDVNNEYDLGYYWVEESGAYDLSNLGNLAMYIDYEAFGRDIRIDEAGTFTELGYVVQR